MRPVLLTYNLTDSHLARLRRVCMRLSIAVRPVPAEEWQRPLASLLQPDPDRSAHCDPPASDCAFQEVMLVMCGFSAPLVNSFLAAMRQNRLPPVALKAVLTPTNSLWSSVTLHAQLLEENRAIENGQKPVH